MKGTDPAAAECAAIDALAESLKEQAASSFTGFLTVRGAFHVYRGMTDAQVTQELDTDVGSNRAIDHATDALRELAGNPANDIGGVLCKLVALQRQLAVHYWKDLGYGAESDDMVLIGSAIADLAAMQAAPLAPAPVTARRRR